MGIMSDMGMIGSLIFLLLIIIIPICIYTAQKWAYKCYKELVKTNEMLALLVADRGLNKKKHQPVSQGIDIVKK